MHPVLDFYLEGIDGGSESSENVELSRILNSLFIEVSSKFGKLSFKLFGESLSEFFSEYKISLPGNDDIFPSGRSLGGLIATFLNDKSNDKFCYSYIDFYICSFEQSILNNIASVREDKKNKVRRIIEPGLRGLPNMLYNSYYDLSKKKLDSIDRKCQNDLKIKQDYLIVIEDFFLSNGYLLTNA